MPDSTRWLGFQPVDTAVFRDGRPFDAATGANADTTLPRPATVAGATAKALGGEPERVAGPILVTFDDRGARPLFGCPRDVVAPEGRRARRLSMPERPAPWRTDLGAIERFLEGDGDPPECWIGSRAMGDYLDGDAAAVCADVDRVSAPLLHREPHMGLWRGGGRQAEHGYLYRADHLRLDDRVAFAVRLTNPPGTQPASLVRLGGERRMAQVHEWDNVPLPAAPTSFPAGRVLVYLATPGIFSAGWRPAVADAQGQDERLLLEAMEEGLVTACVDGPEPVAGWGRQANGSPQSWSLRWAVSAGSVYYVQFADSGTAAGFAERFHTHCLPQAEPRLRTAGFGLCLIGRWS